MNDPVTVTSVGLTGLRFPKLIGVGAELNLQLLLERTVADTRRLFVPAAWEKPADRRRTNTMYAAVFFKEVPLKKEG